MIEINTRKGASIVSEDLNISDSNGPLEGAFIESDDSSVFVIADKGTFVVCDERYPYTFPR